MPAASSTLEASPPHARASSVAAERLTLTERFRVVVIGTAIALLVLAQNSGSVAADTKLDLVVDPARFLRRAMDLWDPTGNSGQLQDQAYGYLFPMGPFFLLGHWLAFPAWVIQRGWESAILVFAFVGVLKLARALGVAGFWPQAAAGLVYALAPRMLSELFSISAELLPVAVLPWVVLPLTSSRLTPRRAAGWSGLALLFAGGINASATLAILPVPALYLLTRQRGKDRAALIRWWLLSVGLACLWWAVPLVTLGRYSPPFLDWIESAAVTTSQNSFIAVARGADHWQAYLGPTIWPGGWIYAVGGAAIVATAAVFALGLAGLVVRSNPERLFLMLSLLIGFVLLTSGHSASIEGFAPGSVRSLLDSTLVAFRNIHKFDPLVRLPVALGVGYALSSAGAWVPGWLDRTLPATWQRTGRVTTVLATLAVGAVALAPAWGNHLVQQPRATAMASFWPQASNWLARNGGTGRALVLPGAGRPQMYWGSTIDEPIQATAKSDWATREIVPFGQPGYVRLLDAVETMVATGTPQPGLAPLLARMGIRYVVLRADLAPDADATDLGVAWSTLAFSPGLSPAQHFGPTVRQTGASNRLIDRGVANNVPAISILTVDGWQGPAALMPLQNAVVANGSADELPLLVADGLSAATPVLFGADAAKVPVTDPQRVTTDGIRKREVQFGHPGYVAATMTSAQRYQTQRPAHDYLPAAPGALSVLSYQGISDIRASSSGSDADAFVNRGPQHAPWYALDDDPATAWESGSATGAVGQWLEVDLLSPATVPAVSVQFAADLADFPTRVTVQTDAGSRADDVIPDARPQQLLLPGGPTRRIRVIVDELASGGRGVAVGIARLAVPGLAADRSLAVPGEPGATSFDFQAAPGQRSGCVRAGRDAACLARLARAGEEEAGISRAFSGATGGSYTVSGWATLNAGASTDRLLDEALPARVTASSTIDSDPRHRPGAVLDGLSDTTWQARPGDGRPTLAVTLPAVSDIRGLQVAVDADGAASRPTRFRLTVAAGRSWDLEPAADGRLTLPEPVRAAGFSLQILSSSLRVSTDSTTGDTEILPPGLSELKILGASFAAPKPDVLLPCGRGPRLTVNGVTVATELEFRSEAALAGEPLQVRSCGGAPIQLRTGGNRLSFDSTPQLSVSSLQLRELGADTVGQSPAGTLAVQRWGVSDRTIRVAASDPAVLVVHENFNPGWQARLAGRRLPAVQVDGWEQGFVLPSGAAGLVHLDYAPNRTFHLGLVLGLLGAAVLVGLTLYRGRPQPELVRSIGRVSRLQWSLMVLALLGVLASWAGLAGGLILLLTVWGSGRRSWPSRARPMIAGLCAASVMVAGLLNAVGPSVSAHALTDSVLCQGLVLLAIAVAAGALALDEPRR